jgi:hypothetical protein
MTRTEPGDVVMSTCARTMPDWPVPARSCSGGLASVWPAPHEAALDRPVFPESVSPKPGLGRQADRSCRRQVVRPPLRRQRGRASHSPCLRQPALVHRPYLHLLDWHAALRYRCSFDPGRDMLCILTSPPRWLQWP